MRVSGYRKTAGVTVAAESLGFTRFRIAPARHLTIGPNWGENQSGDISKSRPFVERWINNGLVCQNWEGLYIGDPIRYWAANPDLGSKNPWAAGIPWADAVAHGELVITQQWGPRQGAAGAVPGLGLPGFEHSYEDEIWAMEEDTSSLALRRAGLIVFIAGDFPADSQGNRQRPGSLIGHPTCRLTHGVQPLVRIWSLQGLTEGYPVRYFTWSGSRPEGAPPSGVAAWSSVGNYWHYNELTKKREPMEPKTEQEFGVWTEPSAEWKSTGHESPEIYGPTREDYIYPWAATHGSKSFRFPLSLKGLKKLPKLDAKSKGWLLWGGISEPGFTFEPEGYEQTGNEYQSKICSELQLPPNFPGTFSAGNPETGSIPSGED